MEIGSCQKMSIFNLNGPHPGRNRLEDIIDMIHAAC